MAPDFLTTADGHRLAFRWTAARASETGVIVMTHGLGEHSGRYGHVVERLTAHGFAVAQHDLRGHGYSAGRRGDAARFPVFLDDLEQVTAEALRRADSAGPLLFYGHSMGGLITLRFLQTRFCTGAAGAVIASPWLRLAFEPPGWKLALGRLARRFFPGLRQWTGAHPRRVSRDHAFLQTLPDRHLVHHLISARLYFGVMEACQEALAEADRLTTPLLMLHGDADPVTSWEATKEFFDRAASPGKELHIYPGTYHETHNDLDRERVLDDIVTWLEQRVPGSV